MSNKILVRTDIIDPHTYLDVEIYYKDLIESIFICGGYAMFQQLYKYYGNKSKGYREVKRMEDLLLVGSERLNNNNYVYLKTVALKYLKYKDQDILDDELTVSRIARNPSYRPFMNSIYSFEYLLEANKLLSPDVSCIRLNIFLDDVVDVFEQNRLQNIHLARVAKAEYREQLETKIKYLGYRSGVYLKEYKKGSRLSDSTLVFVWYDLDQDIEKPILRVLSLISNFLNFVGTKDKLNCCMFDLEIITFSKEREQIMQDITGRTIANIRKRNKYHLKSPSKKNRVISNIGNIYTSVFPDIEGYIKIAVRGDNEFSFVDIDTVERIEKLKEVIKNSKQ